VGSKKKKGFGAGSPKKPGKGARKESLGTTSRHKKCNVLSTNQLEGNESANEQLGSHQQNNQVDSKKSRKQRVGNSDPT